MKIIEKNISELKPYENNPRINDKAIDYVVNSIKEFGMKVPIIIDKNGIIVAGHTRVKALEKLGYDKAPCIIADDLTDEQIKAFRIADNSSGQIAEWDLQKLNEELANIDYDMEQFGLKGQMDEIQQLIDNQRTANEDDFDVETALEKEPRCKSGEVWQLGDHRLMCGDSTNVEDVKMLIGGGDKVDLVVTDPPYNVNYEGGTGDKLKIKNDNMIESEFEDFLTKAFKNMNAVLKNGGAFYIWYAIMNHTVFEKSLQNSDLDIRQILIWNKDRFALGRQDYQWKHEPCLYGWKSGAAHYFIDDRTQSTVIEDRGIELKKLKKDEMLKLLEEIYSDKISTTVFNENKPTINSIHPTMKPIKLLARLIKNSSRPNESVLDLFGGSGSTLIACEQLNRKCYMMEFDPKYASVIIDRWEEFTGKKAIKIKGEN